MRIQIKHNECIVKCNVNDYEDIVLALTKLDLPESNTIITVSCKKLKVVDKLFTYLGKYTFAESKTAKNIFKSLQNY